MKKCPACESAKPHDSFIVAARSQKKCRECRAAYQSAYYRANRSAVIARKVRNQRERRARVRAWVQSYKSKTPCSDCGRRFHFAAMQFDHRPGSSKLRAVSNMAQDGRARIEAEMAKCDLVCANCHAVRSYDRGQHLAA